MTGFQVTEVQRALKGFDYPGKPADLARHAESNGADPELVQALRSLHKREGFSGPTAVMHELSAQADALGGPTPGGRTERQTKTIEGPSWQVTEVQKALKGAKYPIGGPELAEIAESNGADEELVDALRGIRRVEGPNGVMKELKDHLGGSTRPEVTEDGQQDVIDILIHDHREVEQMFAEIESLHGDTGKAALARRKDLVEQVTIELVRHSVAEEAEVYPEVARKIDRDEAEHAKHEHSEAEETVKRLEKLQPDDPSFATELTSLMDGIRHHVAEEEGEMFPSMRAAFSPEELLDLGRKVEAVKELAPTRPHPGAPDEPPGDKLLGPATGLLDRMRDAVTHRGAKA